MVIKSKKTATDLAKLIVSHPCFKLNLYSIQISVESQNDKFSIITISKFYNNGSKIILYSIDSAVSTLAETLFIHRKEVNARLREGILGI